MVWGRLRGADGEGVGKETDRIMIDNIENIQNLLSKIQQLVELDNKQKEEARKRGEKYNIFSVLRMETAEMETHSAFLASLLNPDGDHGMKDAFLESFIVKTGCAGKRSLVALGRVVHAA